MGTSVSCTFSWALFLLFVLSYSDVFVFSFSYWTVFYYSPLEASLFSNEKEKGGESGQEGRWGGTGRSTGTENHHQDILYEKSIFNKIKYR